MPYKFIECKIGDVLDANSVRTKKLLQEDISSSCSSQLPTGENT